MKGFITVKQLSEKWEISEREIQYLCQKNALDGVIKFGKSWAIPEDVKRPDDKRLKEFRMEKTCNC